MARRKEEEYKDSPDRYRSSYAKFKPHLTEPCTETHLHRDGVLVDEDIRKMISHGFYA